METPMLYSTVVSSLFDPIFYYIFIWNSQILVYQCNIASVIVVSCIPFYYRIFIPVFVTCPTVLVSPVGQLLKESAQALDRVSANLETQTHQVMISILVTRYALQYYSHQ